MDDSNGLQFPKETMLELVQLDNGKIVLRPADSDINTEIGSEPLVSIEFSDKIHNLLGDDLHGVGQHMIHSALQLLMSQQLASWHAQVVDEEPVHYS